MASPIEERLDKLGLILPPAAAPAANYVPWTVSGNTLYVSGQLPFENGKLEIKGRVGEEVTLERAQHAAMLCGLNILAQAKAALGRRPRTHRRGA
jgi:enamine deaminase RidA (YjgF/YER057c/UK114 family)